jgi:hypothetical protein
MTSGSWTRRRRPVFPSTRPPDRDRRYRHRASSGSGWPVRPPRPPPPVTTPGPRRRGRGASPMPARACAEAPLPPERGRHGCGRRLVLAPTADHRGSATPSQPTTGRCSARTMAVIAWLQVNKRPGRSETLHTPWPRGRRVVHSHLSLRQMQPCSDGDCRVTVVVYAQRGLPAMRRPLDGGFAAAAGTEQLYCGCLRRSLMAWERVGAGRTIS